MLSAHEVTKVQSFDEFLLWHSINTPKIRLPLFPPKFHHCPWFPHISPLSVTQSAVQLQRLSMRSYLHRYRFPNKPCALARLVRTALERLEVSSTEPFSGLPEAPGMEWECHGYKTSGFYSPLTQTSGLVAGQSGGRGCGQVFSTKYTISVRVESLGDLSSANGTLSCMDAKYCFKREILYKNEQ